MNRPALLYQAILAFGLLALPVVSQTTIQVPSTPVTPGVPFQVVLTNRTSICIDTSVTNVLTLLQSGGELIAPVLVGCGPVGSCLVNGASTTLTYTAPASGPGSSGSFLLLCPYGSGATARLDVGTANPVFPDIHAYPARVPHGPGGHHLPFPPSSGSMWEFASTASQPRVISPILSIYTPGGFMPVASTGFPSLTVPANGVMRVALPLTGLAAGPYTVQADWIDPGTNGPISVRHGIELSSGVSVDLHLPDGRFIPHRGSIFARFTVTQTALRPPVAWLYVVAVGYQPGTMTFPGGVIVPLALDPMVVASVQNGIGGLLSGHIGTTTSASVYCAHSVTYYPVATGIRFTHPGPVLSGLRLRVGALAFNPAAGADAASQPEEIVLQ
jgi:hypothetical protein